MMYFLLLDTGLQIILTYLLFILLGLVGTMGIHQTKKILHLQSPKIRGAFKKFCNFA